MNTLDCFALRVAYLVRPQAVSINSPTDTTPQQFSKSTHILHCLFYNSDNTSMSKQGNTDCYDLKV